MAAKRSVRKKAPTAKTRSKKAPPKKGTAAKPSSAKKSAAAKKPAEKPAKKPAKKTAKKPAARNAEPSEKMVEIQQILDVMLAAGAVELETDDGRGGRLRVRLKEDQPPTYFASPAQTAPAPVFHQASPSAAPAPASTAPAPSVQEGAQEGVEDGETLVSPMVGSFYRAPSPESEPFVQVGDSVGEDTTICLIEAMKVMNEIKAEMNGTVVEIFVENGEPVEFGQPLFRIKRG